MSRKGQAEMRLGINTECDMLGLAAYGVSKGGARPAHAY